MIGACMWFAILWPSIIQMLRGWNAAKEELDANDQ